MSSLAVVAVVAVVCLSLSAAAVAMFTGSRDRSAPFFMSPGDPGHPVAECRNQKRVPFVEGDAASEAAAGARVREFTSRCAASRPGGVHACMVKNKDNLDACPGVFA